MISLYDCLLINLYWTGKGDRILSNASIKQLCEEVKWWR